MQENDAFEKKASKSVSFREMKEVREFPLILGDNPGVSSGGPPVTIDWKPLGSSMLVLNDDKRPVALLPKSRREAMLLQAGFSQAEIRDATQQARQTQHKRRLNAAMAETALGTLQETSEKIKRTYRRWILRKPSSRSLYNQWMTQQQQQKDRAIGEDETMLTECVDG